MSRLARDAVRGAARGALQSLRLARPGQRSAARHGTVGIGLAPQSIALAWHDAPDDAHLLQAAAKPEQWADQLRDWIRDDPTLGARMAQAALQATWSDSLVHWWMVDTPPGTASLSELKAYARVRHEELYGHALDDWLLQADWSATSPSVCCAVPQRVVAAQDALAAACGRTRIAAMATSSRLLQHWSALRRTDDVVVCLAGTQAVLWWMQQGGTPQRVRALRVAAHDAGAALQSELLRAQTRQGAVEGPVAALVMHAAAPASPLRTDEARCRLVEHAATRLPTGWPADEAALAALLGAHDERSEVHAAAA